MTFAYRMERSIVYTLSLDFQYIYIYICVCVCVCVCVCLCVTRNKTSDCIPRHKYVPHQQKYKNVCLIYFTVHKIWTLVTDSYDDNCYAMTKIFIRYHRTTKQYRILKHLRSCIKPIVHRTLNLLVKHINWPKQHMKQVFQKVLFTDECRVALNDLDDWWNG